MPETNAPDGAAPGTPIPGETGGGSTPASSEAASTEAPSKFDTTAREKGWRPKTEFDGDPENWIDAEEFVKRQPLFDKIKLQSKKLKELEKTVGALGKHYNLTITQAKEKAIADLNQERREAIVTGEIAVVEELDKKIKHVEQMQPPVNTTTGLAPEIEQFVEEHKSWFNVDQEMTAFAISYNESYLKAHPGDLEKSLSETLKVVKRAYPDKFVNQRRNNPPPVEGGGAGDTAGNGDTGGNKRYNVSNLNSEQKLVYNQLVKTHKQMSHDDYFKSLDEAGYLEK